ncbi:hypothetical protein MNBD_NITROSPINAE02-2128 [hydrothermal vent metagenome]|uniref:Uncharacterized protein n=1 Tax=hydrothermal vent metagenome TaxID=652676 RepID=A0A3B1CK50_9ZZZZ
MFNRLMGLIFLFLIVAPGHFLVMATRGLRKPK